MRSHNVSTWHRAPAIVFLLALAASALAQTGTITGVVKSKTGSGLAGANVIVVGTAMGAAADAGGNFTIANVPAGSHKVRATFIGYEETTLNVRVGAGQTASVNFSMSETGVLGDAIVVSASRRPEKITEAPASIAVVTAAELRRSSGLTYGEGLVKAKGVDVYRTGIDGVGISARGFMTAYSYRMQLMADGRNSMLPGAGLAAGNLLPVARDDIERLETVLGPSSALYGPNAHNGLVNIITKHPRDSKGTILTLGGGNQDTKIARLRQAGAVGDKLSYKINGEYTSATDFIKNDSITVRASDGKAIYENPDFDLRSLRFDGSLYYSLMTDAEAVYSYGYSNTNSLGTTNVGRNQVDGWIYQFHQLRLNTKHFFVQGYLTQNDAGRTYAIDTRAALELAGVDRETAIDRIKFVDDSKRYNFEAQANAQVQGFNLVGGVNYDDSRPVSNGTYLVDTTGFEIKLKQVGLYGQVERDLGAHFRVVAAGRYDTHDNYDSQFSPRVGLVFKQSGHNFRVTYNRAFQAPAILQQYLYLRSAPIGGVQTFLRGNGRGLTLRDGRAIAPLEVETNTTYEAGYKGVISNKLYIDLNGYMSKYENFISPLQLVGTPANPVVKMGEGNVTALEYTLTYLNFGKVDMNGVDLGLNYQATRHLSFWGNFSYIKPKDIRDNKENDLNKDGTVSVTEFEALSFNTPQKKFNLGVAVYDVFTNGTYASFGMRHVNKYDFISGRHRGTAAKRIPGIPGANQFSDRGPLGGFETFDLNLSYAMQSGVTVNVGVTNLFDAELREMVGSPSIRRLISGEIKYNFTLLP